jgi:hypothetical protein
MISLTIILYTCFPRLFAWVFDTVLTATGTSPDGLTVKLIVLFAYVWLAGSMVVAYLGKVLESRGRSRALSPWCVYVGGYGPLLCAVTFASYVYEARGAEMKWDKTVKTGKVAA